MERPSPTFLHFSGSLKLQGSATHWATKQGALPAGCSPLPRAVMLGGWGCCALESALVRLWEELSSLSAPEDCPAYLALEAGRGCHHSGPAP